jgi:hypothetical protein
MQLHEVKLRAPSPHQLALMTEWCHRHVRGVVWDTYAYSEKDGLYVTYAFRDMDLATQFVLLWS